MTPATAAPGWDVVAAVTLGCLGLGAFLAGSETGLMSVSRVRLRHLARRRPVPHLAALTRLLRRPEEPILTFLIGNNLVNVLLSAVMTAALGARWGTRGEWLAGAVTALLVIVLAEIVPKVIFREYPEPLTLAVTPAIRATMFVLAPARVVVGAWARLLRRLLPGGQTSGGGALNRETMTALMLGHPELGGQDERFDDLLRRFLALAQLPVRAIMVPLTGAVVVPRDATLAQAMAVAAESGYSRLPVTSPDGGVTGWILARDLLLAVPEGTPADGPLPPVMVRGCLCVDADLSPHELLEEMEWQRQQLAIVVDRAGRPLGLVTLEDLVEAAIGRVEDEFDTSDAAPATGAA